MALDGQQPARSSGTLLEPLRASPLAARMSARDLAYLALRDAIVSGRLLPGQLVGEVELADQLSVSRTPLRAAVDRLEHEYLLQRRANGRLMVAEVSREQVEDLYEIRLALEVRAFERWCRNITPERLNDLKACATALRLTAPTGATASNALELAHEERGRRDFHEVIVRQCGNRIQHDMFLRLQPLADRYRLLSAASKRERHSEAVDEHLEIIDALEAGAYGRAVEMLAAHLKTARDSVLRALDPDPSRAESGWEWPVPVEQQPPERGGS